MTLDVNQMYLGTAYYPEHWPRERWDIDVAMMADAGLQVVRIAELAWTTLQPEADLFQFNWVDEFLDVAAAKGLSVILGTPTESCPPWIWRNHPEVVATDEFHRIHGGRGRYCYNNRFLQAKIERLVGRMAERYGHDERVTGWQIDNELRGVRCFCQQCQSDFRDWLRARYGSLEALNKAWGTVFWSQQYSTWEEVDLPSADQLTRSTSQILDHSRFASESAVRHLARQARIIRQHTNHQFITHNSMGAYTGVDLTDMVRHLDFMGWDSYPSVNSENFDTCLAHDLIRGLGPEPYWMLEQKNGYFNGGDYNWAIEPGIVRLWTYQDIARGANGVMYYRWRSNRFNVEQNQNGILRQDGTPRRAYAEVQQVARELATIGPTLAKTRVVSHVGLIFSYDQVWAMQARQQYPALNYLTEVAMYHRAITELGLTADIIAPTHPLTSYPMVVAPVLSLVNDEILRNLQHYVREGGHLILTTQTGIKGWSNVVHDTRWPSPLGELVGMEVEEFDAPDASVANQVTYGHDTFVVDGWMEVLTPTTAQVVATYRQKFYAGMGAITRNAYGSGSVTYVGVVHNRDLVKAVLRDTWGHPLPARPTGIFVTTRQSEEARFTFYINMQGHAAAINVEAPGQNVLSGAAVQDRIELEPWDLAIVQESMT